MTPDDYTSQPPPSVGTTTTLVDRAMPPPGELPSTGADLGLAWLALVVILLGAVIVAAAHRLRNR